MSQKCYSVKLVKDRKKKKGGGEAIPLGNLGFVSCRLLHLSVEAVRIMAVDLLIFQKTWHGEALPLAVACETQWRKFVKQAEYWIPAAKKSLPSRTCHRQSQVTNLGRTLFRKISKISFRIFLSKGAFFVSTSARVALVTVGLENDTVLQADIGFHFWHSGVFVMTVRRFILAYPAKKQDVLLSFTWWWGLSCLAASC